VSGDALSLWPPPRELRRAQGRLRLDAGAAVEARGGPACAPAQRVLEAALGRAGVAHASGGARFELALRADDLPAEGYRLDVGAEGASLRARDPRGLLHAAQTAAQLVRERAPALPALSIRDWPALARRGFMLDVSRDRVPTFGSLLALIETLASLKLNVLQLYVEHTFAYPGHESVWRDASPLTPDEVRALDRRCHELGVELVPNQNSFGHMERWLRHPAYQALGEVEGGGHCLAPGDDALRFVASLYDALLPCFESRRVHVGCDETFELGSGRSAAACLERGRGRVYLDFLLRLVADLHRRGRHVEFWGDIVLQHPALLPELPRKGLTADAWYYEAPRAPESIPDQVVETMSRYGYTRELLSGFAGHAPRFAEAGIPFQVCPGTSSWNALVGRWSNAAANVRDAVAWGVRCGAEGVLLTDWGDNGHLQPPAVSLAPLALAAGLAWRGEPAEDGAFEPALGAHVFGSPALAASALSLGDAYLETGLESLNAAPFFIALRFPLDPPPPSLLLNGTPDAAALERTVERLDAEIERLAGDDPVAADLRQAARLARHGTWRILRGRLGRGPDRSALRHDLAELIALQRERWLATSRPGGLPESLAVLERALAEYGAS
jgi:hypothetical protein